MHIPMTVNGQLVSPEAEPRVLLVDLLREQLGLTGTKVGCDTGQCGSCVVHFNGHSVKSCQLLAPQASDAVITTIEGVLPDGPGLDPLRDALWNEHGVQCGFCTPGLVMSLLDLLDQDKEPDESTIREWLSGVLCRCTGYQSIVRAVLSVSAGARDHEDGQ
jgi:carbon-monoxide dehydrogenase small subunit